LGAEITLLGPLGTPASKPDAQAYLLLAKPKKALSPINGENRSHRKPPRSNQVKR
jgi:hypothetical protein